MYPGLTEHRSQVTDFENAMFYWQALKELPNDAGVYAARSQAHLQLENFMDAAEDAGKAIDINSGMAKAYLRKG